MQIALDPSAFVVLRLDDASSGRLDGLELCPDLRLEALVLDREPNRCRSGGHEPRVVAQGRVMGDDELRCLGAADRQHGARRAVSRR